MRNMKQCRGTWEPLHNLNEDGEKSRKISNGVAGRRDSWILISRQ